jgi:FK506-binding protein 2
MRVPTLLLALTATLLPLVCAVPEGLEIEVTKEVECSRKTVKGDKVDMHYRGTLASDGSEFDASYNRGQPLNFELGAGRVIKGWGECSCRAHTHCFASARDTTYCTELYS